MRAVAFIMKSIHHLTYMYEQVLIVSFVKITPLADKKSRSRLKMTHLCQPRCVEFIFPDYHGLGDKEQGRYMSAFPAFQFAESPDSGTCLLVKLLYVHSVCSRATFLDFLQVK